jgi:DNA mismatch endonuclease (patch repair protein)
MRPDLVIESSRTAIFVDGCFWHGCPQHYVAPRTNQEFWSSRLRENTERDRRQTVLLEAEHWQVVRIWEHDLAEGDEWILAFDPQRSPTHDWRVVRVTMDTAAETWHFEDHRDAHRRGIWVGQRSTRSTGHVRVVTPVDDSDDKAPCFG